MENKPSNSELCTVLEKLIKSWEMEVVEFKEAGKDYDKNKIGQYFSAIRTAKHFLRSVLPAEQRQSAMH